MLLPLLHPTVPNRIVISFVPVVSPPVSHASFCVVAICPVSRVVVDAVVIDLANHVAVDEEESDRENHDACEWRRKMRQQVRVSRVCACEVESDQASRVVDDGQLMRRVRPVQVSHVSHVYCCRSLQLLLVVAVSYPVNHVSVCVSVQHRHRVLVNRVAVVDVAPYPYHHRHRHRDE